MRLKRREFVKVVSTAGAVAALAGNPSAEESNRIAQQQTNQSSGTQMIRAHYYLAGVQVIVDLRQNFGAILGAGWKKLAQKLPTIPNISEPQTGISYMHYVDSSTRVWFLGVQLTTLEGSKPDHGFGLVGWDLGDTTWAVFREMNGQEGSTAPRAYGEIAKLGYDYDSRFIGEFEKFPLAWAVGGSRPTDGHHEFMLPVRKV